MNIAIVGAGIVGITTAYELAADGHAVTVYERRGAAAEESSFANAGVVAPGYVTPWAAPGMPAKVLAGLWRAHAPVRLSLPLAARDLRWMWRWWRACTPEGYARRRAQMQRLAFYSRERLDTLTASLELDFDRTGGMLVLLRSAADARMVEPSLAVLREAGVRHHLVDAAAARAVEPALHAATALHGAVHLPDDGVGNCRQFALLLKAYAQQLGVRFAMGAAVDAVQSGSRPALRLAGGAHHDFDAVVLAAGVDTTALVRPLGLSIPLAPVYGYSVSAPIRDDLHAPRSAVMDERYKVAITRLGQRVRVAGSAELGGRADVKHPQALATLYRVLEDWFPGAARHSAGVQEWKGARPMLPEGPPMVGPSGLPGLWLNIGHGSSGWALACGSARVLADCIAGRDAAVDVSDLGRPEPV